MVLHNLHTHMLHFTFLTTAAIIVQVSLEEKLLSMEGIESIYLFFFLMGQNKLAIPTVAKHGGNRRHSCAGLITAVLLLRQPRREETPVKYL